MRHCLHNVGFKFGVVTSHTANDASTSGYFNYLLNAKKLENCTFDSIVWIYPLRLTTSEGPPGNFGNISLDFMEVEKIFRRYLRACIGN
ncbi:hypothetical protein BC936DRAFT_147136 [Jimgerdemannia flammicorona]|uniref:Uncharacterized protein n=1 Tax=Jimgerdemannia flammicorona TaxID=994334 RepID=A0A433D626_9FUNG|nr:hypothetical protein BC936DRAFT_147136 [Jimgerdemannia flammicorona]